MHPSENSKYIISSQIGSGSTCKIYQAYDKTSGIRCVAKIIPKPFHDSIQVHERLFNEFQAVRLLNHPNIVKYFDFIETPKNYEFYIEYCSGKSLLDFINENSGLDEQTACFIFRQLMEALSYLHDHNISHRDLKPDNIMIDGNNHIKIIDFGLCSVQDTGSLLLTFCGSLNYAAPECLQSIPYIGCKADIWSSGIILYAMCSCMLPFWSSNTQELMRQIIEDNIIYPPHFSHQLKSLLNSILVKSPSERPSSKEILRHPFLAKKIKEMKEFHSLLPSTNADLTQNATRGFVKVQNKKRAKSLNFDQETKDFILPKLDLTINENFKQCQKPKIRLFTNSAKRVSLIQKYRKRIVGER